MIYVGIDPSVSNNGIAIYDSETHVLSIGCIDIDQMFGCLDDACRGRKDITVLVEMPAYKGLYKRHKGVGSAAQDSIRTSYGINRGIGTSLLAYLQYITNGDGIIKPYSDKNSKDNRQSFCDGFFKTRKVRHMKGETVVCEGFGLVQDKAKIVNHIYDALYFIIGNVMDGFRKHNKPLDIYRIKK